MIKTLLSDCMQVSMAKLIRQVTVLAVVATCSLAAAEVGKQTARTASDGGRLTYRLAYPTELYPYSYQDTDTKVAQGVLIDLIEAAARESGFNVKWVSTSAQNAKLKLNMGEVDGIAGATLSDSEEYKINQTAPLAYAEYAVFSEAGNVWRYQRPADLQGLIVALPNGSPISDMVWKISGISVLPVNSLQEAMDAVNQGNADVFIAEANSTRRAIDRAFLKNLVQHREPFTAIGLRLAMNGTNLDLKARMNQGLDVIGNNGLHQHILTRWQSEKLDQLGQKNRVMNWLIGILGVLLIASAIKIYRSRMASKQADQLKDINNRLEETLRELDDVNLKLQASLKEKEEFVAMVAHEIRTPLHSMRGHLELARSHYAEKPSQVLIENLSVPAQSLINLSNDILDYAKIKAGKMELRLKPCQIRHLARRLKVLFLPREMETGNQFSVHVDDRVSNLYVLDEQKLEQVLVNLIGNAFKHCAHGQISLTVSAPWVNQTSRVKLLRFVVADTGQGIPSEAIPHLCEEFYQVSSKTHNRHEGGTGLGLSLCQRMIQLMGGSLNIRSEVGQGSEFEFSVPVDACTEVRRTDTPEDNTETSSTSSYFSGSASPADPRAPGALSGCRLLLVDDHDLNLTINSKLLETLGAEVSVANSAISALMLLSETVNNECSQIDLVLLDINMPDMDGFECAQEILKRLGKQAPPLLAISAGLSKDKQIRLQEVGFVGLLDKPFSLQEAQTRIVHALRTDSVQASADLPL